MAGRRRRRKISLLQGDREEEKKGYIRKTTLELIEGKNQAKKLRRKKENEKGEEDLK